MNHIVAGMGTESDFLGLFGGLLLGDFLLRGKHNMIFFIIIISYDFLKLFLCSSEII